MSITDHIAIAIDFSEPSEVALEAALRLARMSRCDNVSVIHACREVVLPSEAQDKLRNRLEALQERIVQAAVTGIDELVDRHGAKVNHEIVAGRPSQVVPDAARRIGASVLVLGTHARRGLRRVFMGSVAETLLRGLDMPALVMHVGGDGVPPDVELSELDRVLVAVDLHDSAEVLTDAAADFLTSIERPAAGITLLHVVDRKSVLDEQVMFGASHGDLGELGEDIVAQSARDKLEALAKTARDRGFSVDIRIEHGSAPDRILDVATEVDAEAIIIGTHGRGGAPRFDLGSVLEQVLRGSPVVVLAHPTFREDGS